MKRKPVLMELSPDVYKKFKSVMILEGKTVRDTVEKFMRDYVRRKDASRTKNSRARWSYKRFSL